MPYGHLPFFGKLCSDSFPIIFTENKMNQTGSENTLNKIKIMIAKRYNAVRASVIFLEAVFRFVSDYFHREQNEMGKK